MSSARSMLAVAALIPIIASGVLVLRHRLEDRHGDPRGTTADPYYVLDRSDPSQVDHYRGDPSSRVALVAFVDLECPMCADFHATLKQLHEHFSGRLLTVIKHFPLHSECNAAAKGVQHGLACRAAVLARCAEAKERFWRFFDLVTWSQGYMDTRSLDDLALQAGVEAPEIQGCLASPQLKARVEADVADALRVGVRGTPTVFLNGEMYKGRRSYADLRDAIQSALSVSRLARKLSP